MSRPDRVDFAILSPIPEEWNAVCSKLDAQRHPESEVLPTKVGVIGERQRRPDPIDVGYLQRASARAA